ncbi:hypothetical protein FLP41_08920 [Paracoccus marcusii]|uniref:hypothetical protein n=1 Tax=Paracoccus marcusii TaxID=59779 RepID=UPI002ED069D1|nr:hypothetical protein FLP41_08920 [Paracoccus marcusii]
MAYTNDYLDQSDMASASAGLLFIYGIGSMGGPIITGWMMGIIGPDGYWVYMGVLLALLTAYAGWRTTQRRALTPDEQGSFAVITPNATPGSRRGAGGGAVGRPVAPACDLTARLPPWGKWFNAEL